MATAVYGSHQHINPYNAHQALPQHQQQQQQPQQVEERYTTFFCRALFDYQANEAATLSFRKDDIIEVLTQFESGWWDGLLGDERGWFPSNFVVVISEQEAEAALAASADAAPGPHMSSASSTASTVRDDSMRDDSMLDMSQALGSSSDSHWLEAEMSYPSSQRAMQEAALPEKSRNLEGHNNDFWVPQVSQDGRIFYVNEQTGQHSQDIPHEPEDEREAMAAISTSNSHASPGSIGAFATASPVRPVQDASAVAGFGLPRRTRTPEPWVRRLADDGMSYYYVNTVNGQVSWSPPTAELDEVPPPAYSSGTPQSAVNGNGRLYNASSLASVPETGRLRSDSAMSSSTRSRSDSTAYASSPQSDDMDMFPIQRNRGESSASVSASRPGTGNTRLEPVQNGNNARTRVSLTPAEQMAQALQKALAFPPPESPVDLSDHVREAIDIVVEYLQSTGSSRSTEEAREVDSRVLDVVATVRDLLYVTATPSGHIPSHLYPRSPDGRGGLSNQALQSHLKASHRKVAGTLSKLVLSALAMQYDPVLSVADKPNRMESDATELERSVAAFVVEVQRFREQNGLSQTQDMKRLRGVFATANLGHGLPGAGVGGNWRGFGYVPIEDVTALKPPTKTLTGDVVTMLKLSAGTIETKLRGLMVISHNASNQLERYQTDGNSLLSYISSFLTSVNDVNIAQHVDVDGVQSGNHSQYMQTVEKARVLLRTLEASVQALFDDSVLLFVTIGEQGMSDNGSERDRIARYEHVDALLAAIRSNLGVILSALDALVAVGLDQAEISQQTYRNSIEWRRSRISMIDSDFNPLPSRLEPPEDVVDMELAFANPSTRTVQSMDASSTLYGPETAGMSNYAESIQFSESILDMSDTDTVGQTWSQEASETATLIDRPSPTAESFVDDVLEDEAGPSSSKSPPRAAKLIKLLGTDAPQHYITKLNADAKPWYLRPNYDQSEILIDPDGSVRAGTTSALVERLTAHEHGDPTFIKKFLMTFKSFMTLDELFDLLARRFWIQPPPNLNPTELEEWTKLKQHVIRMRVLNVFKSMVTDEDVLEKEDMYILERMKEFAIFPDVYALAAAKQLVILIERAQQNGGDGPIKTTNTVPVAPPQPIMPKATSKKLKLLDIDPTELARQLTVMEGNLYKKIRPMECLQRSRENKPGKSADNITAIIQLSNRIANWVAETILEREDSRKRATIVKHFISVAERCRMIQNFSTMVAIVSGLNTPPIRRLKRTWEQVNARFMTLLSTCEATIDTNKNFANYRSLLLKITPPCVPFIGLYLTTLTFINDGAEDKAGEMVNFRKRQKAAEVIQDIKRWQSKPYNFTIVTPVVKYLEENLYRYADGVDYGDQFWEQSLLREPREREDEKMARLLQESGFL
ncbi:ras GEF [Cristinia sonorae]|uniref:Ras GEF n=1 Tax=Cristinia sonorae TaxID=1940300 RepID=A0A8K0XSN7_9AGAR|nr:ras GEF [Cristinia sonorae]